MAFWAASLTLVRAASIQGAIIFPHRPISAARALLTFSTTHSVRVVADVRGVTITTCRLISTPTPRAQRASSFSHRAWVVSSPRATLRLVTCAAPPPSTQAPPRATLTQRRALHVSSTSASHSQRSTAPPASPSTQQLRTFVPLASPLLLRHAPPPTSSLNLTLLISNLSLDSTLLLCPAHTPAIPGLFSHSRFTSDPAIPWLFSSPTSPLLPSSSPPLRLLNVASLLPLVPHGAEASRHVPPSLPGEDHAGCGLQVGFQ